MSPAFISCPPSSPSHPAIAHAPRATTDPHRSQVAFFLRYTGSEYMYYYRYYYE